MSDGAAMPFSSHNLAFVEGLYFEYLQNPGSVDPAWKKVFDGFERNGAGAGAAALPPVTFERSIYQSTGPAANGGNGAEAKVRQDNVRRLIHAFRNKGHLYADLDPLQAQPGRGPLSTLVLAEFGLGEADLDRQFSSFDVGGPDVHTLRELFDRLNNTYCRSIGVDINHIHDQEIRTWLLNRIETSFNRPNLTRAEHRRVLEKLTHAELFEQFLHTKFIGAKRFSLEGAESLIPLIDVILNRSAEKGAGEVVIGMAHRGRLNVLVNIIGKPVADVFAEFEGNKEEDEEEEFTGDVKYHLGYSSDITTPAGKNVHLSLTFNPSHLEIVNTVVQGRVRAKQHRLGDISNQAVLPLLVHGDAAFAGEGVVMEMLNMSELRGYAVGGTVHVVVNNQVGFTTLPSESRSTTYCTDIAKMLQIPIFHVNGEDPEALAQVGDLAVEFRERFHRDVVIDLWCYRKYGHNEGDEPAFTQPGMYQTIARKPSIRQIYIQRLEQLAEITQQEAESIAADYRAVLDRELARVKAEKAVSRISTLGGVWARYRGGHDAETAEVDTTVAADTLKQLGDRLCTTPEGFTPHPKIAKLLEARHEMTQGQKTLDWGAGEALAFASLLNEGVHVRLTGQDSGRGTFSHRHAVLHDFETGKRHQPLQHLHAQQGPFEVHDSPLCEMGVLGFEYGYSLDYPDALVIWEAQFGDFANTAQAIIDQFLVSGEVKWQRLSGLVMLLPHGMEGQGPEHSSARLGRYLELCASDNMQVLNPTTPAQVFHALRRQVHRPLRKPLVMMSPKSLLRHPGAVSSVAELSSGRFRPVLEDTSGLDPKKVKRVVLCSGKVYYDLAAARDKENLPVAIVRVEQLYPLRPDDLRAALAPWRKGIPLVWTQEETINMGAWDFMLKHLPADLRQKFPLYHVGRPESPSPATGSPKRHNREQAELVTQALKGDPCPSNF